MKKTILFLIISFLPIFSTIKAITPNAVISRGKTVYTSSGITPLLVDNKFGGASWSVSNNSWMAINLGTGPSKIFFTWNNPAYSWSDVIAAAHSCKQNMSFPVNYLIQKSSNSTNGQDGTWTTMVTVTDNNVTARGHLIDFSGASWIKMSITTGGGFIDEVEAFDVSGSGNDSWFFPGTSISANAYKASVPAQNFADFVTAAHPGFTPAMIRGGIPCINSGDLATDVSKYIAANPDVKYWAIEMGTNDAWGGSNYNAATFKSNMQTVINACKTAGIQPIIARMIGTNQTAAGWQVHPDYLKAIDDLTTQNNLIAGPDLYTWFSIHPDDLTSDGVHPNASGAASIQRLWAEKMSSLYDGTTIPVTGVSVTPTTVSLAIGATTTLSANVIPSNATNKNVSWSSSNTAVATVNSSGVVTGINAGTATITVTTADGSFKANCTVEVNSIIVEPSISVLPATASIFVGGTTQLTAVVVPANSTVNVTWNSSNTEIATVSSTGLVTGISSGTATITATITENGDKASSTITVTAGAPCSFGTPLTTGLPTISGSYNKVYVLGTGGPNLSNVTNFTINWNLSLNGLWQMSFNTNNGVPTWWLDLRTKATWTFNQAQPEITFSGSGFTGLDGAYWVALDGSNFVMVSKTGGFTIYFSNSGSAPTCTKSLELAGNLVSGDKSISIYPNPFKNKTTLRVINKGITSVQIVNQTGVVIKDLNPQKLQNNTLEFGEDLPTGLYFVQIKDEEKTKSFKVIKN